MGTVGVRAFGTLPPPLEEVLKSGKAVSIAPRIALRLAAKVVEFAEEVVAIFCGPPLPFGIVDSLLEVAESDQGIHPISVRSKREA